MDAEKLSALLRYVCDHPGCVGYDLTDVFGEETAQQVARGELHPELLYTGLEYEDEMACEITLTEAGAVALARAERAAGHPMRRKELQLERAQALEILDKSAWAVLATADASGTPYCTALNIVRDGEEIYFHSAMKGHKVENLRANPLVCLTAVGETRVIPQRFTTEYESVVVHGTASEVTEPEEKLRALRLLCQRLVPGVMDRFEQEAAGALDHTGIWKIRMDHVTGKGSIGKRQGG